jgi:hypothetical protein
MKLQIFISAIFLSVLLLSGCKEIDKLTHFNIDYTSFVTIPATVGINLPFDVLTPEIQTNSESKFEVNNTHKDLVEKIRLTELKLTIKSPDSSDFSFLKSIKLYILADGLPELEVARKENIPDNQGNVLFLETASDDLKEYIKKDSFALKAVTITDELISPDHEIEIYSKFFVDVKILGQ